MQRAHEELRNSRVQASRADEVVQQAQEVVRRTGRFTREVDQALRLKGKTT